MLGRVTLRDSLLADYKPLITGTQMPGTSLSSRDFVKGMVDTLTEANSSLTQSRSTGVHYSEDFMSRYYPSYPSLDTDGVTNPHYFQVHKGIFFQALPHRSPSEAIAAFFQGPTFADCGSVLMACIYRSIEMMVGTEEFNQAFTKNVTPFMITQIFRVPIPSKSKHDSVFQLRQGGNPIFFLFDFKVINKESDADINIGDIIYIRGVENYSKKHPEGASCGWNVICIGKNNQNENLYLGFGPNLFQTPKTYAEIKRRLIDDYNADPSVYSKNASGLSNSYFAKAKLDLNYPILVRTSLSLNFTKAYEHFFQSSPNWHSRSMLQLASINRNPEPNILSLSGLFTSDNVDNHIRLVLRKFAFSTACNTSVVKGLFLGDVLPTQTNYLLPVMSYFKQQNKKVVELNSQLMTDLKNQNIFTGVAWIDKNAVISAALVDPKADVFVFDKLDLRVKGVKSLIKIVLGYALANNSAVLVYSPYPMPSLSDLIPEHMDYCDRRANNFLVLQTPDDVCKYLKIEPAVNSRLCEERSDEAIQKTGNCK